MALVVSLVAVLIPGVTPMASASSSFYWYGENNSTCWQTGQLGSPSSTCANVGAGYLATPGHHAGGVLENMVDALETAPLSVDPGVYCFYYREGDNLTSQDENNEVGATEIETLSPHKNWQEGDGYNNVCQADGAHWGFEMRNSNPKSECTKTCGMGQYAAANAYSYPYTGSNDRPFSKGFHEPSLLISGEADPQTFEGSGVGGWGFLCSELEDTSSGRVLEICFEEWRGKNDSARWSEADTIMECTSPWDMARTSFNTTTKFANLVLGSNTTYPWEGSGDHHFEATITTTDLVNAIEADRKEKVEEKSGVPKPGYGCGRTELSTNPENYVFLGVSQGQEGWSGMTKVGQNTKNLRVSTIFNGYTPPTASTGAASDVQVTQATLNGTVNPSGVDTHHYFQYGTTTRYGSSTDSVDAGSSTNSVPESAIATGLQPGTTYHYRLVATSEGGTVYGSDQSFTASGTGPIVLFGLEGQILARATQP